MNTFMPLDTFTESAAVLDPVRRWKQVVECRVLVQALQQGPKCRYNVKTKTYVYGTQATAAPGFLVRVTPWYNHPACVMWRGYVPALMWYANEMLRAVILSKSHRVTAFGPYDLRDPRLSIPQPISVPPWVGDPFFTRAHRSNLIRKDAAFYQQYGWCEPPTFPYIWPKPEDYPTWLT